MSQTIPIRPIGEPEEHSERADAAANRARILATAEALFARDGVAATNMADIATAAGVGKGTLYRRFANKGELCLSMMDAQMREFQETMLARLREMTQQGVPFADQLSHFLESLVFFTERHSPLLWEVQRAGAVDERVAVPHFWQHMTVTGLLTTARQYGQLTFAVEASLLADILLAPLSATYYRFLREARGFTPEQIADSLQTLVNKVMDTP